ncbi:MAG TPA: energy transducer TonB [Pyrinomonadaceae bacterium]|nr:energy transducer TonB [Pyrinomonadaceae bacterium]
MTAYCSTAAPTREYQLTILETKPLLARLAMQIAFARSDPRGFATEFVRDLLSNKTLLLAVVVIAVVVLLVIDNVPVPRGLFPAVVPEPAPEIVLMDFRTGGVGFNQGTGEGSGPIPRPAQGGGGGGNRDRNPPQRGELPPPSTVMAAIPITPPINPPALPVAGIDIDPALWKDLKAPVYGEPRSTSEIPSKGPGDGEGIGTNQGTGIGDGSGAGVYAGIDGGTGGGVGQTGCCGEGTGGAGGRSGWGSSYSPREVDQRAHLLSKPEPQYTEEARRNQITGTVVLRAIFSSSGEVVQIRALQALPFGLTEQAIAAARKIKFEPAMKNGRPVSVHLHLEYNFNLY